MANQLKAAVINAILTLHKSGHSRRAIARMLGIHRDTVARYLDQNRPNAPTGSDTIPKAFPGPELAGEEELTGGEAGSAHGDRSRAGEVAKRVQDPAVGDETMTGNGTATEQCGDGGSSGLVAGGGRSGPASTCAAWRDVIVAKVEAGLSAERIHQDLGAEHEFTGSDWSVRRFVRRLKETRELPVRRIETAAGEEAQVDFEMGIFESRRRSEESGSRDNEDRVFSGMARAFDGCSPHGDGRFAPRTNEREISRRTHDAAHAQNVRQEKSPGDRWSPGSWAWFPGGAASSGSPWRSRWSRSCCRFRPRAGARRTQSFSRCSCANSVRRSLSVRYWRRSFTRSRHSEESARRRVF